MQAFKVFLAGSTKSDAQRARDRIRILLSRIQNRDFGLDNPSIALYIHDFKDFKSQQHEYNEFIQNETDIFIAIVDAKYDNLKDAENDIGKGTFAEFQLACKSYLERGKPEIILLYKSNKEHKKPTKRWAALLNQINKYAISEPKFHEILIQLETEVEATIKNSLPINSTKIINDRHKVGDLYEKDGLKGVIFHIDKSGERGKILSIQKSTICTWKEFKKKSHINSPWRVADINELEEIFLHRETLQKINTTLEGLKDGVSLEYGRYLETIWSSTPKSPFSQKAARWSYHTQTFTSGACDINHKGIVRLVADVQL